MKVREIYQINNKSCQCTIQYVANSKSNLNLSNALSKK